MRSIMWNVGPWPSSSSAAFRDIVPVRPYPAPITFMRPPPVASSPCQHHQPDGHAGPDGHHQPELAGGRPPRGDGLGEDEEARGGADVAVAVEHRDARRDLLVAEAEAALRPLDDAAAARMHEPMVDRPSVETLLGQH